MGGGISAHVRVQDTRKSSSTKIYNIREILAMVKMLNRTRTTTVLVSVV